ncbi:MAG: 4'-phosphopantetheinyl transferase superfamily protein [Lentimicrobiaceae bacterium]|nr:4'-phosphopantetheinyl transferase superfamily protein [Lentimicrobiaceae bacterium]
MPLYLTKNIENIGTLSVWKLTENEEELLQIRPLSEKEADSLSSLKSNKRRKEWLTNRILLEHLVGENFSLNYLSDGKPVLLSPELFLSISHSKNFVAVFISNNKKVGIDIERIKDNIGLLKNKFLLPEESCLIDISDNRLLHIYWGAKEAMYKMYSFCHPLFTEHVSIFSIDYFNGTAIGKIKKENLDETTNILFQQIEDNMLVCCFED